MVNGDKEICFVLRIHLLESDNSNILVPVFLVYAGIPVEPMLPVDQPRGLIFAWKVEPPELCIRIGIFFIRQQVEPTFLGEVDKDICREKTTLLDEPADL